MDLVIRNATVVNEGKIFSADVLIRDGFIQRIAPQISVSGNHEELDATGLHLLPGIIDDQVHFREPGLTHKGNIHSESRAAAAGGVTSFMEMPNTVPNTLTQELLEEKYSIASRTSFTNYSFFMGASNQNLEEVLKTNPQTVCGIKVFMGSSTGDMLVDNEQTLEGLFSRVSMLIATHCEDEQIIRINLARYKEQYGDNIPVHLHPVIRNEEACYRSSAFAVGLAKKHGARLHILHVSTAREITLFDPAVPLPEKKITAEVCIHHLWFSDEDYARLGSLIKWNPAVKTRNDRDALFRGLLDHHLDIIATDHAPHTLTEKQKPYTQSPSGGPLIQHSLQVMLEFYRKGMISLEQVVEKMCHAPAVCFRIRNRGYIREGYAADLVLVDLSQSQTVGTGNILAACGWSPFEGETFHSVITHTLVNGQLVYNQGEFSDSGFGQRLTFDGR